MTKIVKPLGTIDRHLNKKEILELAQTDAAAIIAAGNHSSGQLRPPASVCRNETL